MSNKDKNKRLSRDQARQLYDDLKVAMEKKYGKKGLESLIKKEKAVGGGGAMADIGARMTQKPGISSASLMRSVPPLRKGSGNGLAIGLVVLFAVVKIGLSALEASGFASVDNASASMEIQRAALSSYQQYSPEEISILKALDRRRVELEEKNGKLDSREEDMNRRDRELAARLTQLRELAQRLKLERQKGDRKHSVHLDQLANVYGSMNPKEAAELIEQLDITIALSLVERMPDKRIGQILSMMSPERALVLTRMLSSRKL